MFPLSPPTPSTSRGAVIDERSLPMSQLQIIRQLGGVIGLGEVPSPSDPDPVTTWISNYSIALSLMGGKGVALGTDADGSSPMLENDTISTNYPITVASRFGCPSGCPPSLPQYQLGNRTYNFQNDGIANYGLLPDFIQAASESRPIAVPIVYDEQCIAKCQQTYGSCHAPLPKPGDLANSTPQLCPPNEVACVANCPHTGGGFKQGPVPSTQITALFHSAEDTIQMWEKVQNALLITSPNPASGQVGGLKAQSRARVAWLENMNRSSVSRSQQGIASGNCLT